MSETKKQPIPKGGRRGGTTFPRVSLANALKYSTKLVSKSHTGSQPPMLILSGVFNNKGPEGTIRASALKQYGLLDVDDKRYTASALAKQIEAAPEEEKISLLRKACLNPTLFRNLFETYHGDEVTKAKIRQQALNLKVHPEMVDDCIQLFLGSLETAKLATQKEDKVKLIATTELGDLPHPAETNDEEQQSDLEMNDDPLEIPDEASNDETKNSEGKGRAVIQVNVTLDSSLDTDKLEKQLQLLRKYGAI